MATLLLLLLDGGVLLSWRCEFHGLLFVGRRSTGSVSRLLHLTFVRGVLLRRHLHRGGVHCGARCRYGSVLLHL